MHSERRELIFSKHGPWITIRKHTVPSSCNVFCEIRPPFSSKAFKLWINGENEISLVVLPWTCYGLSWLGYCNIGLKINQIQKKIFKTNKFKYRYNVSSSLQMSSIIAPISQWMFLRCLSPLAFYKYELCPCIHDLYSISMK